MLQHISERTCSSLFALLPSLGYFFLTWGCNAVIEVERIYKFIICAVSLPTKPRTLRESLPAAPTLTKWGRQWARNTHKAVNYLQTSSYSSLFPSRTLWMSGLGLGWGDAEHHTVHKYPLHGVTHWLSGRVWKSLWFYLFNNYFLGAYCPGYLGWSRKQERSSPCLQGPRI